MSTNEQRFSAILAKDGTKVVLPLPFDPGAVWGAKERHHLSGSINGIPYRGESESADGRSFLTLGAAWRRDCGLGAGDTVAVVLRPEPPQLNDLSADVAAALVADPAARGFFESLPSFYRKNWVRWIEGAKKPETRAARIAEMVRLSAAGERER